LLNIHKIVVIEQDADSDLLIQTLEANGYKTLKTLYNLQLPALLHESQPDVIIFNLAGLSEKLFDDLAAVNQHRPVPVILFAKHADQNAIQKAVNADVSALVIDGFTDYRVAGILHIAIARFNRNQAQKDALEEVRTQLQDRKQIDRAKAILIKTQNFTEHEAYHTLRKLAMDRKITLGEMAKNVIALAELLK
jgi:response regulator NasT